MSSRRASVLSALLMLGILSCWLFGQLVLSDDAPAVAFRATEQGALLTWVNTRDADAITVRRCRLHTCVFVDLLPTSAGRLHALPDPAAQPRRRLLPQRLPPPLGGLDFVRTTAPTPSPHWQLLPLIAP